MPAFFAHHRFGEQVVMELPDELQEMIAQHKDAFQIGLQGPDIFFFYRPWEQNEVLDYGHHLHEVPARELFQHGMRNGRSSAAYVYMLGVVCHYALDAKCHPYVAQFELDNNVPHMEIESEFEKMLMRRDGLDPFTYRTDLLIPTDENTSEAVYQFYDEFDAEKMQFVLRHMQHIKRILIEPRAFRQAIGNKILNIIGLGRYKPQMLQLKDNPICAESNDALYQLYENAISYAVALMCELDDCKQYDEPLSKEWDSTFD